MNNKELFGLVYRISPVVIAFLTIEKLSDVIVIAVDMFLQILIYQFLFYGLRNILENPNKNKMDIPC